MTLKTRNRFIRIFLYISVALTAAMLALFLVTLSKGTILTPPELRIPSFLNFLPFTPSSLTAVMTSFLVLALYACACFYLVLRFFENTQTSEIIFFTGFLLACLAEFARFITICLGLWQSFSNMLIFVGNIVLFGRILAPLSFFCAAILSETSQRQDIEKNYIIMITVSLVFAAPIPMNTARIASTGLVTEGFHSLINVFKFLLFATAILSFFIQGLKKNNGEYKHLAVSASILLSGYTMIICCDNFLFLILGTALLFFGTYRYLAFIHKLYMWS